ncbi:MAG: hypothetical protein M0R18_09955 [Deltaproteobacteria bacterium]|jgi:hypothetical protein|nr:hypothetical protein [Deltaproteobacteria bacterium]MDD3619547.1 hypothetical protein [Desulfobulbaceae bacterium]
MIRKIILLALLAACITMTGGCRGTGNEQNNGQGNDKNVTETGTSMGGASIVRSAELNLSGDITARMIAPKDASTTLTGNCSPDMWANFGIQFNHPGYVWIAVTIMTKDPIQTGQTGPVRLEWVDVSFFSEDMKSHQFRGPGSFEIKEHNAAPDNRRMVGVIRASGLEGRQDAEGKTIDAEFDFDVNFSCGVIK